MRFRKVVLTAALMAFATPVIAHVRVVPGESKPGVRQTYTVRVPTEGSIATTSVELEIPPGLSVASAPPGSEVKTIGGSITSITWRAQIAPGESRDFIFDAVNPAQAQSLVWKAHQHFADGSVADWIEPAGGRRPAATTKLQ